MRVNADHDETQTAADLKRKHLRRFGFRTLAVAVLALLAALIGSTDSRGAAAAIVLIGGIVIVALTCYRAYRGEKRERRV